MVKFEQQGPKEWNLVYGDDVVNLKLLPSSVTNKFHIVADYIQRVSEFHQETFSEWFIDLLKACENTENKSNLLMSNLDQLKQFSDEYFESLKIDYTEFVDESKAKKNSILFNAEEILEIIRLSCYLKIYSVFSNNEKLKIGKTLHKAIYAKLSTTVIDQGIASKIFDVVKTKTFRYNLTDKFMWDYIKTIQCKDIGVHIIEIFNFIMNNIIVLCEEDKNPITYFVGVIDESVKWFLRSVYKGTIVYDDEISTEDIHGTHINNLRTYSFNDTLGRLKGIAFEKIYERLDQENILTLNDETDQYIIDFNNRLLTINFISPLCSCFVFPLLAQLTKISYVHFKTISPEHAAVLSYYTNILLQKVFKTYYRTLFTLLDYFPLKSPSVTTTYTVKRTQEFIGLQDETQDFFGFNTKIPPYKILSHFIGRVSRIEFCHLLTGKHMTGIPLSKIESDMMNFFTLYFGGKMEQQINEMTSLMSADF